MIRKCSQVACVGVLVGGALYMAQFGASSEETEVAPSAGYAAPWPPALLESNTLDQIAETPAYRELQISLDRVRATRQELMQVAASGRKENAASAVEEYQTAIRRMQAALERVKNRVMPGEFHVIVLSLASPMNMQFMTPTASTAYTWELGPYAHQMAP